MVTFPPKLSSLYLREMGVGCFHQVVVQPSVQLQKPDGHVGGARGREPRPCCRCRVGGIEARLPAHHLGPCKRTHVRESNQKTFGW